MLEVRAPEWDLRVQLAAAYRMILEKAVEVLSIGLSPLSLV